MDYQSVKLNELMDFLFTKQNNKSLPPLSTKPSTATTTTCRPTTKDDTTANVKLIPITSQATNTTNDGERKRKQGTLKLGRKMKKDTDTYKPGV